MSRAKDGTEVRGARLDVVQSQLPDPNGRPLTEEEGDETIAAAVALRLADPDPDPMPLDEWLAMTAADR